MKAFTDELYLSIRARQALTRSTGDAPLLRSRSEAFFSDKPARSWDVAGDGFQRNAPDVPMPAARKLLRLHGSVFIRVAFHQDGRKPERRRSLLQPSIGFNLIVPPRLARFGLKFDW
jgi:hypothetical protein